MDTHSRPLYRDAAQDFTSWRAARLRRAGFTQQDAALVAGNLGMDLHALLELIERGCPPHLAARILAPLA
jgi:hypothetical protein